MQLRYVAIAMVMVLGCRKEGRPGQGSGSAGGSGAPAADAATPPALDAAIPPPIDAQEPKRPVGQGEACPDGTPCETGLSCVKYVAVTGQSLATCEIPCKVRGGTCPAGQACTVIADGPGEVCQRQPDRGSGAGSGSSGSGSTVLPRQAEPCPAGRCAAGLACVEYYGIAGPRGGKFTSCEIRCGRGGACPGGQRCVTVADGPGQVCRPSR